MTQTTIRRAAIRDLEDVCRLLQESDLCYEDVAPHLILEFVVAESAGRIVGVAGLEICGDYGFLRSVVVDSDFQNCGIAAQMIRDRLHCAQSQNFRAVYLLTLTAERYFARIGFSLVPRDAVPISIQETEEFRRLCPDNAVAMVLPFDSNST